MKFNALFRRRMKKLTKNRIRDMEHIDACQMPGGTDNSNVKAPRIKWENCVIKVKDDYHVLDRVKSAVASVDDSNALPFEQYQVYYEGIDSAITSSKERDLSILSNASLFVGMHPGSYSQLESYTISQVAL